MQDEVTLFIGSKRIKEFISYSIESDIFTAADQFQIRLFHPEVNIKEGQQCKLRVNGDVELIGIIDRIQHGWDKNGQKFTIEGRDLMGLVVDRYLETFKTEKDITIKALAEQLLAVIPFINRKSVIYGKGDKVSNLTLVEDTTQNFFGPCNFVQIKPGKTTFEILQDYAKSRGLIFFNMPDGTFVFGEPVTSGKASYSLICKKNGDRNNNTTAGNKIIDISRQYKKVTVLGQRQGTDLFGADEINVSGVSEDPDFPFDKPFISISDKDGLSPEREAKLIMEQQQFESFKLEYKTYGHSQNGKNYQVNTICHVEDDTLGLNKDFLIYARTFEMSKTDGTTTTLSLSKLGILPE